jgi:hypothetical protein
MPFPMKEPIAAPLRRSLHGDSKPDFPLGRWLAGGAALAGASAGDAAAALVQIDLNGNVASVSGFTLDDQTNPDLTGDGFADLTSSRALTFQVPRGGNGIIGSVAGYSVEAGFYLGTGSRQVFFATLSTSTTLGTSPTELRVFVLVTFTDVRINGGTPTSAALEVSMRNLSPTDHEVRLLRIVFDDADPGAILCTCPKGEYPQWVDPSVTSKPKPPGKSAKKRQLLRQIAALKRQISSLEALIRNVKTNARPISPRLHFQGTNPATLRYLLNLERRLLSLRQQLRRL